MEKNFLRYSKSFLKKGGARNSSANQLKLLDLICREADENYVLSVKSRSIVEEALLESGISLGKSTIFNNAYLLKITYKWLTSDVEGKKAVLNKILDKNQAYSNFLRSGIKCLEQDGIRTVADLERLAELESRSEFETEVSEAEPNLQPEVKFEDLAETAISIKLGDMPDKCKGDLEMEDIDRVYKITDQLIERFKAIIAQNQALRENCDQLEDEINRHLGKTATLEAQEILRKNKIEELARKLSDVEVDIESLQEKNIKLIEEIKNAEQRLLEKDIEINICKSKIDEIHSLDDVDMLFRLISRIKTQKNHSQEQKQEKREIDSEEVSGDKTETKKSGISPLPDWSKHYNRNIVYAQQVPDYLSDLRKKVARSVISSIQALADHGYRYPSLQSERIFNINQIKCGKYRLHWEEKPEAIYIAEIFKKGRRNNKAGAKV